MQLALWEGMQQRHEHVSRLFMVDYKQLQRHGCLLKVLYTVNTTLLVGLMVLFKCLGVNICPIEACCSKQELLQTVCGSFLQGLSMPSVVHEWLGSAQTRFSRHVDDDDDKMYMGQDGKDGFVCLLCVRETTNAQCVTTLLCS